MSCSLFLYIRYFCRLDCPLAYQTNNIDYQFDAPKFTNLTQFKNFDIDCPTSNLANIVWSNIVCPESCDKCGRCSTTYYPLKLTKTNSETLKLRKFGLQMKKTGYVDLCECCVHYVSDVKPRWREVWPSVLFTFFFGDRTLLKFSSNKQFFSVFPYQIQASWLNYAKSFWSDFEMRPIFRDLTRNINHFTDLIESFKGRNYIEAMNSYAYPSIRCFCGASSYIDDYGIIPFQHLLNFLDRTFTTFEANHKKFLCAIRSDYFDICDSKIVFELRPSVSVEHELGLVLLTCKQHDGGSALKLVHVARHPLVGNLSHPHCDRLAPVASSMREATIMKIGEFSNTWSISKSVAGRDGAGSLVLHSERNFAVKSQALIPALESTFLNNRNDMIGNMQQIASENHLPQHLVSSWFRQYKSPEYQDCLQSATVMPMSTIKKFKDLYETTDQLLDQLRDVKKVALTSSSSSADFPQLLLPTTKLCECDVGVAVVVFFFLNIPPFAECAILNNKSPALDAIFQIVLQMNDPREKITELIDNLFATTSASNTQDFPTFLTSFFSQLQISYVTVVESVQSIQNVGTEVYVVVVVSKRNLNLDLPLLISLHAHAAQYKLLALDGTSDRRGVIYYKERISDIIWTVDLRSQNLSKISQFSVKANCRYALYIRCDGKNVSSFALSDDIEAVKCPDHKLPFCVEVPKTQYLCSFDTKCSNKVSWRCPVEDCGFSLCKKHHTQHNEIENIDSKLVIRTLPDLSFRAPTASTSSFLHLDTDSGATHVAMQNDVNFGDNIVSMHALLNDVSSVLKRCDPIQASRRLKRFFQRFLCLHPSSSTSLIQIESLVFPSIFFHQQYDGSFPGAIPFFLYSDENDCRTFGYQSLLQHFQTRLSDPTLLTSSNAKYIQFAADTLLNLNLKGKHTQDYIKRGIQSIELDQKRNLFENSCNTFSSDTEMRVDELAAAMRSNPVTLFLTLSCNQKGQPGVSPLKRAVDINFQNASPEERKSANQAYMTTFVRNWSRAVKFLIQLLLRSSENLLGKIHKFWGRAEFQSLAGNLQHYHFLIWLTDGSIDKFDLVQCSEKHILQALLKIADSSLNIIDDQTQLYQLYDECLQFHTHSCEKAKWRCMKRRDLEGNKICRTPPYPPSHVHWLMPIHTQYPHEALKVLETLDLAERIPGTLFGLRPAGELKCEKFMYAASKGEHIIPTCGVLFCLTRSSTNLLLTTERFACSYLSSYTSKTEEHADGSILPATDGKSFRLRIDAIQNKHLASVRILNQLDKQQQRDVEKVDCRLVSLTESVFWTLGLPYVITNMAFVHVQNVPPELRYVRKTTDRRSFPNTNYITFRDDVPNLQDFQKLTFHQIVMAQDLEFSGQGDECMTSFSLRPPELMCVTNVELFYNWFTFERSKEKIDKLKILFKNDIFKPWINARGWLIKLRPSAIESFRTFLLTNNDNQYTAARDYNLQIVNLVERSAHYRDKYVCQDSNISKHNAEVVFATVHPRRTVNFLVAFVLRFGNFETELELFQTDSLIQSYVTAGLLTEKEDYTEDDLKILMNTYVKKELKYIPGGALSFSGKLLSARRAFSLLLNLQSTDNLEAPVVLISEMREKVNNTVDSFLKKNEEDIFLSLQRLKIPNLPTCLNSRNRTSLWLPILPCENGQSSTSKKEQMDIIKHLLNAINRVICGQSNELKNNHVIIGKVIHFCKS